MDRVITTLDCIFKSQFTMQQHEDDVEYDMINFIYVILASPAISKGSAYQLFDSYAY